MKFQREPRSESINLRVTKNERLALERLARSRRTSLGGIIYPVVARMAERAESSEAVNAGPEPQGWDRDVGREVFRRLRALEDRMHKP